MLVLMTRISVEQLEDLETIVELSVFTRVVYDGGQALPESRFHLYVGCDSCSMLGSAGAVTVPITLDEHRTLLQLAAPALALSDGFSGGPDTAWARSITTFHLSRWRPSGVSTFRWSVNHIDGLASGPGQLNTLLFWAQSHLGDALVAEMRAQLRAVQALLQQPQ